MLTLSPPAPSVLEQQWFPRRGRGASLPGGWSSVWGRLWLTPGMGRATVAEAGVLLDGAGWTQGPGLWWGRGGLCWAATPEPRGLSSLGPWLRVLDPGQLHKPLFLGPEVTPAFSVCTDWRGGPPWTSYSDSSLITLSW